MGDCFKIIEVKSFGRRRFYDIPTKVQNKGECNETDDKDMNSHHSVLRFLAQDLIGKNSCLKGPYGQRMIVYCDYIASGRALNSIENYIQQHILPTYGNTHTTTTVTSLQSSMFMQESRLMIRNAVRANEHDAVIFCGNGVTGAVDKLINALNLKDPPVVFAGPHEHHSNLLPWREIAFKVVRISETSSGQINLKHLELVLESWKTTGLPLVGCFSAASNITGIIADTILVSSLMHKYGGLVFWDYATAGPYLDIDMHPLSDRLADKDAVFLSMHKFVGGVDAPGVLIAKRSLFKNRIPSNCGGGSVFFVTRDDHRYLMDEEAREEGGTPRVIGSVKAALAMEAKQSVGVRTIMKRESALFRRALDKWKDCPNLRLLGVGDSPRSDRIAIFSFLIHCPEAGTYLHHNFVAALLNDLFGIQARGGCACAGPYAQDLLGIDEDKAKKFEEALLEDSRLDRVHLRRQSEYSQNEVLRPGFVRINLSYVIPDDEADFVIDAVAMVAEKGWRLLPQYMFNPETGEWRHIKHKIFSDRKWLGHVKFTADGLKVDDKVEERDDPPSFAEALRLASGVLDLTQTPPPHLPDHCLMFGDDVSHLRWFLLPSEAQIIINKQTLTPPPRAVINVRRHIREMTQAEMERDARIDVEQWRAKNDVEKRKLKTDKVLVTNDIVSNSLLKQCNIESRLYDERSSFVSKQSNNDDVASDTSLSNNCSNGVDDVDKDCGTTCSVQCLLRRKSEDGSLVKNGKNVSLVEGARFISPPKRLFKLTQQAIEDFAMIENGDKVLVCLSGGKDSLSLLHVMRQYQFYARSSGVNFDLGAVTIDPMTSSFDPSPLIPYMKTLGVAYFYEEQNILDQATEAAATSICAFCSRMKRGRIYACARREGWNILAFAHHLDDLAESFLMSAFHNGLLRTMKANYRVREGDLRVIRPFIYVRETDTRLFAESANLPVIPENCPACFEAPKERHRMKQLLAAQEILHPGLFYSLKETMQPLYAKHKTGLESRHQHDVSDEV